MIQSTAATQLTGEPLRQVVSNTINGGFSTIAVTFLTDSLSHMIPWLIVTASVVMCDLAFGIRKSHLMGEEVRFSNACRRTLSKMVTYFSFVCMVCMINTAAGADPGIDKYACLFVCAIEGCSILSNYLKPKGYNLNAIKLLSLLLSRWTGVAKEDLQETVEKQPHAAEA